MGVTFGDCRCGRRAPFARPRSPLNSAKDPPNSAKDPPNPAKHPAIELTPLPFQRPPPISQRPWGVMQKAWGVMQTAWGVMQTVWGVAQRCARTLAGPENGFADHGQAPWRDGGAAGPQAAQAALLAILLAVAALLSADPAPGRAEPLHRVAELHAAALFAHALHYQVQRQVVWRLPCSWPVPTRAPKCSNLRMTSSLMHSFPVHFRN